MCKERKETLAKLDRIILFLTEQRVFATRSLKDWETLNESIWTLRNARKEVIDGLL